MSKKDLKLRDILKENVVQVKLPDADTYKKILDDMVMAFLHQFKGCETEASTEKYCKNILDTCITGYKKDGTVWKRAPGKPDEDWYTILKKRLKMHRYDLDNKKVISNNRYKIPRKDVRDLIQGNYKTKTSKEIKEDIEDSLKPASGLTLREKALLESFKEEFRRDFPMSTTVIDEMMMNRLGMLYVLSQRDYENLELTAGLTNEIIKLAESLGLAGRQRISQADQDRSGTINELIQIYKETKGQYFDIEQKFKIEELKLIVNAIERGTLEEFLGMDYIRRLYGDTIDGEPVTFEKVKEYVERKIKELNFADTEE